MDKKYESHFHYFQAKESGVPLSVFRFLPTSHMHLVSATGQMLARLPHIILPSVCYLADNLPFALISHILL